MREHTAFAENLMRGRIAEIIFELMCREATAFDVCPLGYEQIISILHQLRDYPMPENGQAITHISENPHNSPDFLLCLPDKTQVYLVEVKLPEGGNNPGDNPIANKIHERWHSVKLFVATLQGCYFDSCKRILETREIKPLPERLIPKNTQVYYLDLLRRFEQ